MAQVDGVTSLCQEKVKRSAMAMGVTLVHREWFNVISLISMGIIMCLMSELPTIPQAAHFS